MVLVRCLVSISDQPVGIRYTSKLTYLLSIPVYRIWLLWCCWQIKRTCITCNGSDEKADKRQDGPVRKHGVGVCYVIAMMIIEDGKKRGW